MPSSSAARLGTIDAMGGHARSRAAKAHPRRHVASRPKATGSQLERRVNPVWLTVSQLCQRWQLGRKTVYKFIDAKILPARKFGRHLYRVAMEDVLRFEAQNRLK